MSCDGHHAAGFVVWDATHGTAYRSRIYPTAKSAESALRGIVWHSRERYQIRPIALIVQSILDAMEKDGGTAE